jgi:hypothetical protein
MESQAGRKCLFCGHTAALTAALTKEHVMPRWIWREAYGENASGPTIQHPAPSKYRENITPSLSGLVRTFEPRTEQPLMRATSMTVRAVCRDCNNGWMARLEDAVKPVLTRVNRDRTWSLSQAEVAVLRRWVLKTGLMLEQADSETTLAEASVFEAVASNQTPPGSWYIGLGRAHSDVQFRMLSSPVVMQTSVIDKETGLPEVTKEEIFAMEHIIAPWQLFFILRYSPHPVIAPARLDHDLVKDRRGRPIELDSLATGRRYRLKDLPLFTKADLDQLMFWGHVQDRRRRGGLHLGYGPDGTPAIHTPLGSIKSLSDDKEVIRVDAIPIDVTER